MPDWTKRVKQERAKDLRPGEQVVAACYYQGLGSARGQIAYGMTAGVLKHSLGMNAAKS